MKKKGKIEQAHGKKWQNRVLIIGGIGVAVLLIAGGLRLMKHRQSEEQTAAAPASATVATTVDPVEAKVDQTLAEMSLEEKVGQLFLARVPAEGQTGDIQSCHLGGYLLFSRDFENETPETLKAKIQSYQNAASTPMLIASDEEGGEVTRISSVDGLTDGHFGSPQAVYASGGLDAVKVDTDHKSQILKDYGINYNLAPVADVATDPGSFIYSRTAGLDAGGTAEYIKVVVTAMKANQEGSCLKHFPGYGDNGDSHGEIIRDDRSLDTFEQTDFVPFEAGIDAGADSVLVSHNIMSCLDTAEPASLSGAVHDYLRNTLHFDGVIITDDFDMKGLSDFIDQDNGAVQAVQAGNDMMISSSYKDQIPSVVQAVQNGTLSESAIDASVRRILKMKINLGIITL